MEDRQLVSGRVAVHSRVAPIAVLWPPGALLLTLALTVVMAACNEARDDVAGPQPPITDGPPFAISAPSLIAAIHPTGWQRSDCTACHTVSLIGGHVDFEPDTCIRCHGYNRPGEVLCGTCHGVPSPDGFPPTGLHRFHVEDKRLDCSLCHDRQIHRNGAVEIGLRPQGAFVSAVAGSDILPGHVDAPGCTDVGCHEPRAWDPDTCDTCHASPPDLPMHRIHLAVTEASGDTAITCRDCHADNQHDALIDSGIIEVGGPTWTGWDRMTGDCTTTCHEDAKTWDCTPCHGYPPATGRHGTHVDVFGVPCEVCHADHLHTYRAAISPMDRVGAVDVALLFLRGTYDAATSTCADVGCHGTRQWED